MFISDECKSHYVYIKDFNRFMCNKTKNKSKKYFCKCCLQCFSSEKVLIEHKEDCLVINRKQNVRLKSGKGKLKNYFKQLPAPFKIYADFECALKKVKSGIIGCDFNSSYTKTYQDHIPCSVADNVVCINNKFSNKAVLYRRKNAVYKFIKSIFNEYNYCRRVIKKLFSKNLMYVSRKRRNVLIE